MADLVAVMRDGDLLAAGVAGRGLRPAGQPVRGHVRRQPADERPRRRPWTATTSSSATRGCRSGPTSPGLPGARGGRDRPAPRGPRLGGAGHGRRAAGIGVRRRADGLGNARRRDRRRDARDGAGAARDDLPARRGRRPRRGRAARLFLRRGWHDRRTATGHRALRLSARGDRRRDRGGQARGPVDAVAAAASSSRAWRRAASSPPAASWRPAAGPRRGSGRSSAAGRPRRPRTGASSTELKGTGEVIIGGFEDGALEPVQERDPAALHQGDRDQDEFLLEPYDSFFSKALPGRHVEVGPVRHLHHGRPVDPAVRRRRRARAARAVRPDGGGRPTRRRSSTSGSGRRSRARA